MGAESDRARTPVVIGDARLEPPRREGDCTCAFCSLFRRKHLIIRASIATLVVPLAFGITAAIAADLERSDPGVADAAAIVPAFYIVATMATVLAIATWYQPVRRLLHVRRPRSTEWPPPTVGLR